MANIEIEKCKLSLDKYCSALCACLKTVSVAKILSKKYLSSFLNFDMPFCACAITSLNFFLRKGTTFRNTP